MSDHEPEAANAAVAENLDPTAELQHRIREAKHDLASLSLHLHAALLALERNNPARASQEVEIALGRARRVRDDLDGKTGDSW